MEIIDIVAIIIFAILLLLSIFTLFQLYLCDDQNCKAFNQAKKKGQPGTKEYTIALLEELCGNTMWQLPYIGATLLTFLSLWFIECPITVRNFTILFLISFVVIYIVFCFFINHHIQFIVSYVNNYIRNDCIISED